MKRLTMKPARTQAGLASMTALLVALALAAPAALAQSTGSITGTVVDSLSGETLPGVNVVITGGGQDVQQGTSTGTDGTYQIDGLDPATYDVRASFVGYTDKTVTDVEVSAGEATQVDFELAPSSVALEEVVVSVGYGTQRRQDVTSSVSSVDISDADVGSITSPQQLIQGKAAGVSVTQNSGQPGSGLTVRVRGGTSINASNDPLYVIDGVPIDNSSLAPGGYGGARNPLNFLNPDNIESIDVLKDASATAIYGARGSNGVVLIETKGGEAGRVQISVNSSLSTSAMARQLDLLTGDEYRNFVQEQVEAGELEESQLDALGEASTDWQEAITHRALSQNHSLALSGGMENAQFRTSLGYTNDEGIVISSAQEKITGRFNGDLQAFDDRLRLSTSINSAYIRDDYVPYEETGGFSGAAFAGVLKFNPTLPVRNEEGDFTEYSESTINPVAAARQVEDFGETSKTIANFTAAFDVLESLTAQLNLGGEYSEATRRTYLPRVSPLGEDTQGRAEQDKNERQFALIEGTTTYNNTFGSHSVNAVAGASYQRWVNEGFGAAGENFITDFFAFNNLEGGANAGLIPYSYKNEHKLASVFGRLNYDYDGRYLASLSLRRDGSSRFGANNRWGLFPAASMAWRASRDLPLPDAFSDLKLRVGYGETGNQEIGNYLALQTLAPGFRAVFDQQVYVGVAADQFANPDLQWEETATFNAGIDYGFLGGRLRGSLDYYWKNTDNLLVDLPVPQPAVVSSQLQNVGSVRNTGFELSLEALAVDREDLSVSFNLNASTNTNEVVSLGGRDRIVYGSVSGAGLTGVQSYLIEPGRPIGTFYGPEFVGFRDIEGDDVDGPVQVFNDYEDTDGDGIGDRLLEAPTADPSTEDRQVIGNAQEDLTYGFNATVNWRNWDANLFIQGKYGQDIFNNTALTYTAKTQALTSNNFLASAVEDPTTVEESPTYSSRWIQDGSYLRLDNLSIGYTFAGIPQVSQARVYVRGSNLLLITPYSGIDPEISTDNTGALPALGVDYLTYPRPRTFTLGVNLSF